MKKDNIEEDIEQIPHARREAIEYAANLETVRTNRWRLYDDRNYKGPTLDTTTEDLDLNVLEPGWIYVVNNICAYEATAGTPQIKIGFVRQHQFHILTSQTVAAAENSVDYAGQAVLYEGDKIRVRFEGATSTDAIWIFANGYKIKR